MILCVCVSCHPIYPGRHIRGRTSRGHTGGRSHRISPPSFYGACLNFYREKESAVPFPRRPCSRILCTHELIDRSALLGHFFFFFCERKNSSSCDCTEIRTHFPTSEGYYYYIQDAWYTINMCDTSYLVKGHRRQCTGHFSRTVDCHPLEGGGRRLVYCLFSRKYLNGVPG